MSLFIFPVPSAASPLPHPVRQPCWVSHSLPELLAFTCVISLASLECLSSSKSQVHCCLLRELLGAFQFLPLGWKPPVSWLRRTLKAIAGLKPQSAHRCSSNTKYGTWHWINVQWTNCWDWTDQPNECMWHKAACKIICSYVATEVTVKWLSKMHRHKEKGPTKDPFRLNREMVGYVCWIGLGLLAGILGPAQSLELCACRV